MLAELAEGFHEVRSRAWLWVTVVVFALAVPLGYAPLFVLGPTIAEETYDSAAVFGVATASYGAGALAGALIGFRWRPRHPMRAAFLVIAVWPVMLVAFATGVTLALVVPLALATGIGFALLTSSGTRPWPSQIPPRPRCWRWAFRPARRACSVAWSTLLACSSGRGPRALREAAGAGPS